MEHKEPFGSLAAKRLKVGDLVLWKNYHSEKLGVIIGFDIKVLGGRPVSVARIVSADGSFGQAEVFTINLKVLSESSIAE
jgi:hypothetical protein|tara:strand:+ start:417 stop:656 length:240 start_codon:yes stop_codon:yes gene_type:complete